MSRIRLLSRPGCHLCDDAREVIAAVCVETGDSFDEVSVDSDDELRRLYSEQVPVVFVDGRQHDFWRVDPDRLRRALTGGRRPA
jgi:glutaredoxin